MPSLEQLAKNLENYRYYSGYGTFNANNLPYGQDRPGGGSSRQPFVVRGVDTRWSPSNFDDGLTPFGVVTLLSRTAADLSRVTQFLYTTTKGPLFLLKQTGLQRLNPNIRQIDVDTFDKKIIPTQLYNPLGLNTLAQVALGPLGARFTKHGLIPQTPEERSYEKFIKRLDNETKNRLSSLTKKLSSNPGETVLFKYAGGPGSIFGIGNTSIRRYSNLLDTGIFSSLTAQGSLDVSAIAVPIKNIVSIDRAYSTILIDPTKASGSANNTYEIKSTNDFRKYKNSISGIKAGTGRLPESDYTKYNIENRIGIARVRTPTQRESYASEADTADRINEISLYYSNKPVAEAKEVLLDVNGKSVVASTIRDIIKFRIKVYDNDRALDPKGKNYGVYMVFRAYISNIKRSMIPKWDAYKYVGRGESFYAYDGFTETVSINFVIAASTRAEMKPLYQKLNYLISTLTPDYSQAGLMRGNIAELTVGDFLLYQPGIITAFDMIIDEDSNWEIALSEPENGGDEDMHELPQIIKCTMTFIPIYNFLPRKSGKAPFIGIDGLSEPDKKKKQWLNGIDNKLREQPPAPPKKKGTVIVGDASAAYLSPGDTEFFNPTQQ